MIVLHVDDDQDDREIMLEALREVYPAIEMHSAENGIKALSLLKEGLLEKDLNFIFLDIKMPLMDGVALLALIRGNQKLSKVPVYIYSTVNNEKELGQIEMLGAKFIQKNSDYKGLVKTLGEIFTRESDLEN
jgi:CheY-like chemotaxis protein